MQFKKDDCSVQELIKSDFYLGRLIKFIGTSELYLEEDGFKCLVKYIIGQQISDKARETIWQKLCVVCQEVTPEALWGKDNDKLKQVGVSQRKVEYIETLAEAIISKKIDLEECKTLKNDQIISILTQLRGIGPWTAEMYLIFSLGRLDVLSASDGTIRRVLQWLYGLERLPTPDETRTFFEQKDWLHSATIVSAYFWKAIELNLTASRYLDVMPDKKE